MYPDWACDACRLSPHGKSPSSPCLECTCSNSSVLHTVSGGSPLCPRPVDPCDHKAETNGSCSLKSQAAQLPLLELSTILETWRHQQVVDFQQVVESSNTPLSLTLPSTAAFAPDPGLKTALPLASIQGVNSTPIHGDGSGITSCHADCTPFLQPALRVENPA